MARISTYVNDTEITGSEQLLATNSGPTSNILVSDLADFINSGTLSDVPVNSVIVSGTRGEPKEGVIRQVLTATSNVAIPTTTGFVFNLSRDGEGFVIEFSGHGLEGFPYDINSFVGKTWVSTEYPTAGAQTITAFLSPRFRTDSVTNRPVWRFRTTLVSSLSQDATAGTIGRPMTNAIVSSLDMVVVNVNGTAIGTTSVDFGSASGELATWTEGDSTEQIPLNKLGNVPTLPTLGDLATQDEADISIGTDQVTGLQAFIDGSESGVSGTAGTIPVFDDSDDGVGDSLISQAVGDLTTDLFNIDNGNGASNALAGGGYLGTRADGITAYYDASGSFPDPGGWVTGSVVTFASNFVTTDTNFSDAVAGNSYTITGVSPQGNFSDGAVVNHAFEFTLGSATVVNISTQAVSASQVAGQIVIVESGAGDGGIDVDGNLEVTGTTTFPNGLSIDTGGNVTQANSLNITSGFGVNFNGTNGFNVNSTGNTSIGGNFSSFSGSGRTTIGRDSSSTRVEGSDFIVNSDTINIGADDFTGTKTISIGSQGRGSGFLTGTETVNIGSAAAESNVSINGTAFVNSTTNGTISIDGTGQNSAISIGTGTDSGAITLGRNNAASSVTIPRNLTVSGSTTLAVPDIADGVTAGTTQNLQFRIANSGNTGTAGFITFVRE